MMLLERRAGNERLEAKMVCDCSDDCDFEAAHNCGVDLKAVQAVIGCQICLIEP